jgi:hypothetical protein
LGSYFISVFSHSSIFNIVGLGSFLTIVELRSSVTIFFIFRLGLFNFLLND